MAWQMTDLSYQAEAMTYAHHQSVEAEAATSPTRKPVQLSFDFDDEPTNSSSHGIIDIMAIPDGVGRSERDPAIYPN